MADEVYLTLKEAEDLAMRACRAAGASHASAQSLVEATLSAALYGPATLGFPHFVDYLNGFVEGRINGNPTPRLERSFPASLACDADAGIAQLGFDLALDDLLGAARTYGIAIFTQSNSFTTGELGYYVRTLANNGVIGLAATNANAMVVSTPGGPAVYSTNPLAFGFPLGPDSPPMVIDQASSATAFVNIVRAAEENQPIPEGWAVDADGGVCRVPPGRISLVVPGCLRVGADEGAPSVRLGSPGARSGAVGHHRAGTSIRLGRLPLGAPRL